MRAVQSQSKIARDFEAHEEIFLARYSQLRAWALQLTANDRERAEDLVHDAYIQFTFAQPELASITNLNGYLYTLLRNLQISQIRRSLQRRHRTISIIDYDSAEIGLRATDPRELIRIHDQLREVCRYACMRKESSKAGSVLVLRFLHGYYPREIARLVRCTREAVEERLRIARNEARQYLANPKSLRFIGDGKTRTISLAGGGFAPTVHEFLNELRRIIFESRKGECCTAQELERLYSEREPAGINQATLAHIVSCPVCLERVNGLLGLPSLDDRFPTDTLGNDTNWRDGSGGDDGGTTGGTADEARRKCRKAAREVYEHKPSELCASVNGYLMAAQRVGSELNEQTVNINNEEPIEFVEILSEQNIRLLFLKVADGTGETARASVALSDERRLTATLDFNNPWPTLQVVYSDPSMAVERLTETQSVIQEPGRLRNFVEGFGRFLFSVRPPRLPETITAALSLILVIALLLMRLHVPVASASELLSRSIAGDEASAADVESITHRTVAVAERRLDIPGQTLRLRVETWQSAAWGLKMRRIFDEQNRLIAAESTSQEGNSTIYRKGMPPQREAKATPQVILDAGEFWRLDPSAAAFKTLVPRSEAITVDQKSNSYVLNFEDAAAADGIQSASLTLIKANLHVIAERLIVAHNGERREYTFTESNFEKKAPANVAPELLQPDSELQTEGATSEAKEDNDPFAATAEKSTADLVASPELEVQVAYLLNRIKADLGEQVSLSRTAGGRLRVEALAEDDVRKDELLRALAPVRNNPAVTIEVVTVAEATRHQTEAVKGKQLEVEVANEGAPADAELRKYFSARVAGSDAVEIELRRYSDRLMKHSRQALLHASALKKLVARFSPAQVHQLDPETQRKCLAMIRDHTTEYNREINTVRAELKLVFNGSRETTVDAIGSTGAREQAQRLFELSYEIDNTVRAAFTISAGAQDARTIKSSDFWRSLNSAEKFADAIVRSYEK